MSKSPASLEARVSAASMAPSTQRRIYVNIPSKKHARYPANKIKTSKYTILTFLPKNLYEQFHGLANFYFLGIVILQGFPEFSQVNIIVPTLPILIILLATAIKDAAEDLKRHKSDQIMNQAPVYLLEWDNTNYTIEEKTNWKSWLKKLLQYPSNILDELTVDKKLSTLPDKITANDYIIKTADMSSNYSVSPISPVIQKLENVKEISSTWTLSYWKNIRVGDFVFLRNNDRIPADLMIISTGEADGACYVETKNLDGETNLKIKKGPKDLQHIRTPDDCKAINFIVDAESPSANLYSFNGAISVFKNGIDSNHPISVGPNGILLRGCVLRNTSWIIGLAVYTGNDTKIMLNSGPTPSKRTKIDRQINPRIILNAFILVLLCLICAFGAMLYSRSYKFETASFIGVNATTFDDPWYSWFLTFFNCFIIFQNIIPIALYISLEIAKMIQSYLIHMDIDMYDEAARSRCYPKAWNLCDDLGQIEYIFSDKTGTLTSNVMDFKKASINGIKYGKWSSGKTATLEEEKKLMESGLRELFDFKYVDPNPGFIDSSIPKHLMGQGEQGNRIREFFSLLALCHTVLVEKSDSANPNLISYRAQSPDESALVNAAKNLGFACLHRSENKVEIDLMGELRTYTVLNVMEFNSDRKRMSVIIERPEGDLVLMCKGADSVIFERLDLKASESIMKITSSHLEGFANDGLRTLCLAFKVLDRSEYEKWNKEYKQAQAAIENREAKCDALAELIERDMHLMGATAIEDKLQDGVPESIALLAKAGIKLWVLTGDKVETAINIGFSCNLLLKSMTLIVIQAESSAQTFSQIREALITFWDTQGQPSGNGEFALVIDGFSLKFALEPPLKSLFLELGCRCKSVLCCRVSPLQKALVVKLVREGLGAMCLAIGDGANDVSMIQEADIGIGISGKEGLQAVMASDYGIAQFRFLSKLLLVHGRWAYVRCSELVLGFFYKNIVWLLINFWYQFYCGFTGGNVVDFTYSIFFNTFFTIAPTILVGVFDQDLNAKMSLKVPQIYLKGIRQKLFRTERLWIYIAHGIWDSLILYFAVVFMTGEGSLTGGKEYDYVSVSTITAYAAIFAINIFATANWFTWTIITRWAFYISIAFWLAYTLVYYSVLDSIAYGATANVLNTPNFFLIFFIAVTLCLLPKFILKFTQQTFYPSDTDILRESQSKSRIVGVEEYQEGEEIVSFDSSTSNPSVSIENSKSPEKTKHYVHSSDGFEGEPTTKSPTCEQNSVDPLDNHVRASSIQQVFQKGVHFFSRMKNEPKNRPKIAPRSSSIVYMNGTNREGVANTGFAFSQEPGMQDIITPHREFMEDDKSSVGKTRRFAKLRNFSNSIQSMLGLGISRSSTPIPRDVQDRYSIDSLPNPPPNFMKTSIGNRSVSAISKKQRPILIPTDIDDDEASQISRNSANSETGSRSSPTRQLPFKPDRGQK